MIFFFKINEVLGNYHDLRWKSRKRYINFFAIGFKFQINNNIFISTYFSEVKMMWNVAEKSIYYHNYYLFIYHFKFPTLSLWWLNTYHVECNSEFIFHFVKKMTWVFRIVNSSWCFHSPIFVTLLFWTRVTYIPIYSLSFVFHYQWNHVFRCLIYMYLQEWCSLQKVCFAFAIWQNKLSIPSESFMSSTSYRSRSLILSWLNTVSWT